MSDTTTDALVIDNTDDSRYEIHSGGTLAGFAEYELSDGIIDFTHTEVFEKFSGKGLAQELAARSLDESRERGLQVLPHCGFYAKYIARNPEYVDLVPVDRRAAFGLA